MRRIPVSFVLLGLTAIAGTVSENGKECIDENREYEGATEEKVTFEFKVPNKFNGNPKTELTSWTIFGPDEKTKCKNENLYNFVPEKDGNIESCNLKEAAGNCVLLEVTLPKFHSTHAGIWNISREYLVPTFDGSVRKTENHSINVYETEFDRRYNGTIVQVKEREYIVVDFYKKNDKKSECRLINRETNETYDLNSQEHRFSGKSIGIQKLDGCSFRMQIENKSEGLWSFVGEFGWNRQRANFQIFINSSVSRETKGITRLLERPWVDDFPIKVDIMDMHWPWGGLSLFNYWELERPDGKILLRSDMYQKYININQITREDEGIWKIRESSIDSMVLMERNFSVTVENVPEICYFRARKSNYLRILFHPLSEQLPTACILKNQNGRDLVGKYYQDKEFFNETLHFLFDVNEILYEGRKDEWEFALDYNHTMINGLILRKKFSNDKILRLHYLWKSVQRLQYVVRGEKFKVKCWSNKPLKNCTLTNPNNVTKYFLDEFNSLITRTNCYKKKGFCGCILTIRNANDTHVGSWNWEMEFKGSRKVNSLAPISVVDSYLIAEIEQHIYENRENNLKLNCRPLPTMHYRKIRYCKWFDSEDHQILTKNSTKYKKIMENNICRLELKVSHRKDLNIWKCVAGLDGSSEKEIHATFDLSKMSFNVTEEEPKENLGIRDGFLLGILPLKLQDNASKKLPEAFDISPGLSQQKISEEKLENSPGEFDINTIIMLITILISIVSLCLAVYYCVYYKMQIREKIRKAQSVRKLLVEIEHGPLDPGAMLNEHVDYIQYDEDRWEYPCGKLIMLNKLGTGNFGIVEKAKAPNIVKDGKKTKVAIKRAVTTTMNDIRALVYELKILSSLTEKHPHIVNFLGACTKNVPNGGFWLILEYCRCGSLHDFIKNNKSEFVSQFECIIVGQIDSRVLGQINQLNPDDCKQSESGFVCKLDDEGGRKTSKLSICSHDSHEIAYNERDPSTHQPRAFSTGDLMEWGWQVASGMQFLSENKILHGDLAARNVLLTDNRMAKICDFGLARSIPNGYYHNQINNEMPFKYLAIESLEDRKYSTKTDVWSFGIFLWECFSLGKVPYEEHFTGQSILDYLSSGKRLDKPIHSTNDLYQIMLLCWKKEAKDRPTFVELVQKIHIFIEESKNFSDDVIING